MSSFFEVFTAQQHNCRHDENQKENERFNRNKHQPPTKEDQHKHSITTPIHYSHQFQFLHFINRILITMFLSHRGLNVFLFMFCGLGQTVGFLHPQPIRERLSSQVTTSTMPTTIRATFLQTSTSKTTLMLAAGDSTGSEAIIEGSNNDEEDNEDDDDDDDELSDEDIEFLFEEPVEDLKASELVWRYAKKPLLRIGVKGATLTHGNSLRQLLEAHTVVKVKVNTKKFDDSLETAFEVLRGLAVDSGAPEGIELIQARASDKIILLGMPGTLAMMERGEFPPPPPPPFTPSTPEDE